MVRKGRSFPMQKLDMRQFYSEWLAAILASLLARRAEKAESLNRRSIALPGEVTNSDDTLKRLYRLVDDGLTKFDDVLKEWLNTLKTSRPSESCARMN